MKPRTKKSETLQVRLPHGMKKDFMQRCDAEGRAASDVIRDFIDSYLARPVEILNSEKAIMIRRRFVYPTLAAAAAVGAVITFLPNTGSASTLQADFDALDVDKNGLISPAEFKPVDGIVISTNGNRPLSVPGSTNFHVRFAGKDGDVLLNFDEYSHLMIESARLFFINKDLDLDARVSKAEYVTIKFMRRAPGKPPVTEIATPGYIAARPQLAQRAAALAERFDKLDANHDGFLSLEEATPS